MKKTTSTTYLNLNQINAVSEINAAVVNISGRQRMLSQRTAMLALKLVCDRDRAEQEELRSNLLAELDLMERSHDGLVNGDLEMKLLGNPSPTIQAMYFQEPINLDRQIRQYIASGRALAQAAPEELTRDNPYLQNILKGASKDLLEALDAIVSQYQKESEAEQQAVHRHQAQLYRQSCAATAAAKAQAQMLEKALHELQQAQIQLIKTEKMSSLGHLVAGVAHEINNPVSFIYGNLNHAKDYIQDLLNLLELYQEQLPNPSTAIQEKIEDIDLDFLKEDLPKVMTSMEIGADRICQIVRSLRNFSRTDEEVMQKVDIHEGVNGTLLILQNRLKADGNSSGIQIIKEYGDLPPIECYPGQMNQVFMNLLSNAIDALELKTKQSYPQSRPTIWIRTEILHSNTVSVRIADNGAGMTEEVKARLYESFFTTKPVGKGTGLGLSISYEIIVEKHNGSLDCISQPGKGTEFGIEIPVRQREQISASKVEAVATA